MTTDQFYQLLTNLGYDSVFFGCLLGLFISASFLYDEGTTHIYFRDADYGWLCLLLIPVELCVLTVFLHVMLRYLVL